MPSYSPGKARTSQRTTTATEVRAGPTTFMVRADSIFVNPLILGFGGVPGLEGKGLPFAPTLTVTCLSAGLLSIAMGVFAKYPLALAPGMGLNAVVAFELVAGRGLTWPQAMTVVFCDGLAITVLVLTRFREAMMTAVARRGQRASGPWRGGFASVLLLFSSGVSGYPAGGPLPVALGTLSGLPILVFLLG